ncbi:MAG: hypothetical protein ACC651_17860, partial [Candidatus Scalindua sp.]
MSNPKKIADIKNELLQKIKANDKVVVVTDTQSFLVAWVKRTRRPLSSINKARMVNVGSSTNCPGCHDAPSKTMLPLFRQNNSRLKAGLMKNNMSTPDHVRNPEKHVLDYIKLNGAYVPAFIQDVRKLSMMLREIGIHGNVIAKTVSGKSYVL